MDIALGVVGAIVGGFIASFFGIGGVTGVNIGSIIIAVIGAVVVLWIYHAVVAQSLTPAAVGALQRAAEARLRPSPPPIPRRRRRSVMARFQNGARVLR